MGDYSVLVLNVLDKETTKSPWKLSFPHVLVATIVSFLFGSHLGLVFKSKLERGDEIASVKLVELLYGQHSRGSAVELLLMDKVGRKALLICSFFTMGISMAMQVITANFSVSSPNVLYLYLTGMLLFVLMFAIGAGPVPALLLSEIFPNRIRAKAMAFGALGVKFSGRLDVPAIA